MKLEQAIRLAGMPWRFLSYQRFRMRPLEATFDVTWNCMCRCDYCSYWKENHADLTLEQAKAVIGNLSRLGVVSLGISGGEPLLRRDIGAIVAHAKQCGMFVGINSNGMIRRPDLFHDLMGAGLDRVSFSLDGARAETHERFRKNCPIDSVIASIKDAVEVRRQGNFHTRISTTTVIHKGNIHELAAIVALRKELGADRNNFQPVMHEPMDDDAASEVAFGPADTDAWQQALKCLRELPGGSLWRYCDVMRDFNQDRSRVRALECYAGRAFVYVNAEGILYPCSMLLRPLADLSKDDALVSLRKESVQAALHDAARQKCGSCSLLCYMERNVLLNSLLSPQTWLDIMRPVFARRSQR